MIVWPDFVEVAERVADVYPHHPWPAQTAQTIFNLINEELPGADMEDVWGAVHHHIEAASGFSPKPDQILAGTRAVLARRLREEPVTGVVKALPTGLEDDAPTGLRAYLDRIGVDTLAEAIEWERESKARGEWQVPWDGHELEVKAAVARWCEGNEHVWGIVEYRPDGDRVGVCGRCYTTRVFESGRLLTKGEMK